MSPGEIALLLRRLEAEHGRDALATAVRRCRLAVARTAAEAVVAPHVSSPGVARIPPGGRRGEEQ